MAISIEDRFDLWHRKVIPPMAILGHAAFSGGRYFQFYLDKAFVSPIVRLYLRSGRSPFSLGIQTHREQQAELDYHRSSEPKKIIALGGLSHQFWW